jgi:PTH1 family peptidyl-tRNA hydrolase
MQMNYIFIGLGNPGEEYENTRHNTGRIILETLRKKEKFPEWELDKKSDSLVSKSKIGKSTVTLVLPETFMNKSGNAACKFIKSKKAAENLVVVHDDLDMPIGKFKIVFNRGSGGHRGVESIMKALKTEEFARLKFGISKETSKGTVKKPKGEKAVQDHILGKFKGDEEKEMIKSSKIAADALAMLASEGRERAMGEYN